MTIRIFRFILRGLSVIGVVIFFTQFLMIYHSQAKAIHQTVESRVALPLVQREENQDISISVDHIVASGFENPLEIVHAGDGSNRLFIVEQGGYIQVIKNGSVLTQPFLDIHNLLIAGGEQGLLGLAFHPAYETNGYFYLNYTRSGDGATVIERYEVSGSNPDRANPSSAETILIVPQPNTNHNGGKVAFGPDGYLYAGLGDGGGAGDTYDNGQDPNTLLGTILRLDVDRGLPYTIPSDNPFVGGGGNPAVWSYGLRNPWKFSFDRVNGDILIGDVGQGAHEEIDFQPANAPAPVNYGWPCMEGFQTFSTAAPCNDPDLLASLTDPILDYPRTDGRSVTGGYVYRGTDYPMLYGRYFYADFATGRIWSIFQLPSNNWSPPALELDTSLMISSFGEDEMGELYIADYTNGTIRQIRAVNLIP